MEALAADLAQLERALADGAGRPQVVHHFATWCDPCEEELPHLGPLLDELGARTVAVSWDLFMVPVEPAEAVRVCTGFLERLGAPFDLLCVYTGPPEALFASQGIAEGTVPYTDVRDRSGSVVETFPRPLTNEDDLRRLRSAVRAATDPAARLDGGAT